MPRMCCHAACCCCSSTQHRIHQLGCQGRLHGGHASASEHALVLLQHVCGNAGGALLHSRLGLQIPGTNEDQPLPAALMAVHVAVCPEPAKPSFHKPDVTHVLATTQGHLDDACNSMGCHSNSWEAGIASALGARGPSPPNAARSAHLHHKVPCTYCQLARPRSAPKSRLRS